MRASWIRALCGSMMAISGVAVVVAPRASAVAPQPAETLLVLAVQGRNGTSVVTLTCDPAGGIHPNALAACTALAAAGGNFSKLTGQPDTICPDIIDPVTAQAQGRYNGAPVSFQQTYPSPCDLARHTGPIFQFASP